MELNQDTQKAITNLDNGEEEIELQNVYLAALIDC